MTSTALELKEQPRAVQFLYRQASLPASIIPKALQLTPKDSPEKRAQKEADRLMWALTAHSLGLDIGTAVKHVAVIAGAPVVSAEMARRVAIEQGCEIEIVEANDQGATVRGRRGRTGNWSTVSFTRRDAERAGFFDIVWELGWGNSAQTWPERWFDIIDERMVRADESTRPKWASPGNKDAKRKFREAYFRWPTAMFLARASTLLTRTIAPVATIQGVPLVVDDELDAQAARDAVVVEGESQARADRDDEILDAEFVDAELVDNDVPVTPAQVTDSWQIAWKAACTQYRIDKATSSALLSYATARPVQLSSEVTDQDERAAAMNAVRLWANGELEVRDGRIVEVDGGAA